MTAQVFFIAAQAENALVLPVAALRFEDRGAGARQDTDEGTRTAKVQVMGPGGQREERTVQVGVTDCVHEEIVSGLDEGEQVVICHHSNCNNYVGLTHIHVMLLTCYLCTLFILYKLIHNS